MDLPWGTSVSGFVGYVSGTYDRFDTGTTVLVNQDFGGAKYTWGINGNQRLDLGHWGEINISGNYYHRDPTLNTLVLPATLTLPYNQANARIEWSHIGGTGISLAAFGRDLIDGRQQVRPDSANQFTRTTQVDFRPPTIYGVELGYEW